MSERMELVSARLGFARADDVIADPERKGLLRAQSQRLQENSPDAIENHQCALLDWGARAEPVLSFKKMGFDCIDLSARADLQHCLEAVHRDNQLSAEQARSIRHNMARQTFRLSDGRRLTLLFIAPEGMIMRRSGPNGLNVDPSETVTEMNGHRGASMVHGDQDVYGLPLSQMLKGAAPWLFRHRTPNGKNQLSPLTVLNIWIPLHQITQPLTLMDRRTLDNQKHQLRYSLSVDHHLDRERNDIWLFLHDASQQWYFNADMDQRQAYVFDTLGVPHGAASLSGEDIAEQYYGCLKEACAAVEENNDAALKAAVAITARALPADTTAPLRAAIAELWGQIEQAQNRDCQALLQGDWRQRSARALDKVVRKSIEMRAVALIH